MPVAKSYYNYDFETDETSKSYFRKGVKASERMHDAERFTRMYNTVQFIRHSYTLRARWLLTTVNGVLIKK